jgi:hypothetical protein
MYVRVPMTAATSFLSIRNYVETTYGVGSFRRVRDAVVERGHPEFPQVMVPNGRYPTAMLLTMVDAAHDVLEAPDFYESCGRAIVAYEVNVFLRYVLKLASPLGVVERATESWRQAHSTGMWQIQGNVGDVVAELTDFETTAGYCRLLRAYFERLFQLTGAEAVTVEHPACRGRGDPACRYRVRWRVA